MNEKIKNSLTNCKGFFLAILIIVAVLYFVKDADNYGGNIVDLESENEELKEQVSMLTQGRSIEEAQNCIVLAEIAIEITGETEPNKVSGWFEENMNCFEELSRSETERYVTLGQFIEDGIGISDPRELDEWLIQKGYSKPINPEEFTDTSKK